MTYKEDLIRLYKARIEALENEVDRLSKVNEFLQAQLDILDNEE